MKFVRVLLVCILIAGAINLAQPASARVSAPSHPGPSVMADGSMSESEGFWLHWTTPVEISGSDKATWPTVGTVDGQTLYAAWSDGRSTPRDIYYARSTDGGENWGSAQPVVGTANDSLRPSAVMSGSTLWLAWADNTVGLEHEIYGLALGSGSPTLVPNGHKITAVPQLALGLGGELHMVLHGGTSTNPDILYTRRAAGATAWPATTVVFANTDNGSWNPSLAVSADGQVAHLVWEQVLRGIGGSKESEIRYMRGQRSGQDMTWGTPITLSVGITTSVRPAIAVGTGSTVHVVWSERMLDGVNHIRYSRSTNGGVGWSMPPIRLNPDPVNANQLSPTEIDPAVAVTPSGAVCAAWHGFLPGGQDEDVYLTCSTDGGQSWERSPINVSRNPDTLSIRPALAVGSDGLLHLAWQEHVGGDILEDYRVLYVHSIPYAVHLPIVLRSR